MNRRVRHISTQASRRGELSALCAVPHQNLEPPPTRAAPLPTPARGVQSGAYFVETALITPLLLMIIFASIFFCVLAAKNFALQSFATDIARDVSLSLQPFPPPTDPNNPLSLNLWCPSSPPRAQADTVDISAFKSSQESSWKGCAQTRYPIGVISNDLTITITAYPIGATNPSSTVAAGDLFSVSITYPVTNFLNGAVPFLGSFNYTLKGTAVGVIERP